MPCGRRFCFALPPSGFLGATLGLEKFGKLNWKK
jgi:hypothetical protein